MIFEEAKSGLLKANSVESILGSLLAFSAMLQNQQISMGEYYQNICDITLKYRDSKETVIRKAVITLIPSMANYDTDEFEQHYLHRSMNYLLHALGKPTDRDISELEARVPSLTLSVHLTRPSCGAAAVQDATVH